MRKAVIVCAGAILALWSAAAFPETVKLSGSATVVNAVVSPNRDRIEKASAHTLQIVSHATGKGLVDLVDRQADLAMISSSLETALATAEAAGRKIDPAALRVHDLRSDDIVFLVNAANPVNRLSLSQLGDIHTGKITNWKQVGGKDQPITVYTTAATGATSAMVRKVVMAGADYAPGAKTMISLGRIADVIPADEGGIGALGRGFVKADGRTKVLDTGRISRPLAVVTLGEPSAIVRQVIDALKTAAAGARIDIGAACPTQVRPEMPRKAMQEGLEGMVKAQVVIRDGAVKEVAILSGPRVFHAAVRDAMLQYKCAQQPGEAIAAQEFVFKGKALD
jgi:phosphate transport system substrate-binding protein